MNEAEKKLEDWFGVSINYGEEHISSKFHGIVKVYLGGTEELKNGQAVARGVILFETISGGDRHGIRSGHYMKLTEAVAWAEGYLAAFGTVMAGIQTSVPQFAKNSQARFQTLHHAV